MTKPISTDVRSKFHQISAALHASLIDRGELIDAMLLALVSKHHAVAISPPGCAKSMAVRAIAASIDGSRYFERLLSKFSTEEDCFGPRSLAAMKVDRWERVVTNTLVDADIAFVDEIFKCNGSMLNSMLTALNERLFSNGAATMQRIPLWSVLGASNELPEDPSLGALYDRFLFRVRLNYIEEESSFLRMLDDDSGAYTPPCTLTFGDLQEAHDEAMRIDAPTLPDAVKKKLAELRTQLTLDGITVSDRRWKQCATVLRAAAWLDGSEHVELDHFDALRFVLWSADAEIAMVNARLTAIDTGIVGKCVAVIDDAMRAWHSRPSDPLEYRKVQESLASTLEDVVRQVRELCVHGISNRVAIKLDARMAPVLDAQEQLRSDVAARYGLSRGR